MCYLQNAQDLQEHYFHVRERFLGLPPTSDRIAVREEEGGYVVYSNRMFSATFMKSLAPAIVNGIECYPIRMTESRATRETLVYNAAGTLIQKLPPPAAYNPRESLYYDWLVLYEPFDMMDFSTYLAMWDPAFLGVTFYLVSDRKAGLLPVSPVTMSLDSLPVLEQMAAPQEPVTNIVIRNFQPTDQGMMLEIAWPEAFTNRLEVLITSQLGPYGWLPMPFPFDTAGLGGSTNWLDPLPVNPGESRFYTVGNADQDTDQDSLTDAREKWVYGSNPLSTDSDGDTLGDGQEVHETGTEPRLWDTDGDELNDGREVLNGLSDPLAPDTDGDTLGDGVEVLGYGAWTVQAETSTLWCAAGTQAVWLTQWPTNRLYFDRLDSGLSEPLACATRLGRATGSTIRVAADGYILVDAGPEAGDLSRPDNLPLPCAGNPQVIAPFWDNLVVSASTGIWVSVSPSGWVVTWVEAEVEPGLGRNEALDIQCVHDLASGTFEFRYRPAAGHFFPGTALCTVGLQGGSPESLARVAFNTPGIIEAGKAVTLTPASTAPRLQDTDTDGWVDPAEALMGMDPLHPEAMASDEDRDGLTAAQEWSYGTDPKSGDTDLDGFLDGDEAGWGTDPTVADDPEADADQDGLTLRMEWMYGTSPFQGDSDSDGVGDGLEASRGSDPADPSDYGVAGETFEVELTLRTGTDEGEGTTFNGLGTGSASLTVPPGTIFQIGNIRLRAKPGAGAVTVGQFRLTKGRTYELLVYTLDGQVQSIPIFTAVQVDGLAPVPLPGGATWICGPSVIERPAEALGLRPTAPSMEQAGKAYLHGVLFHLEGPNGETPPASEWPLNTPVTLKAVVQPALEGSYTWTTDVASVALEAQGSNATVMVSAAVTVTAFFTPAGASAPLASESVLLKPAGHVCRWGGLEMTLPGAIPCNRNDSDGDGIEDRAETPPPPGDPDLRVVTLSWNQDGLLDCCKRAYANPRVTLSRLSGGDRIRMWNEAGTEAFAMPFEASLAQGPWTFALEGVAYSENDRDVRLLADVMFDNADPTFAVWATTVLRVSILQPTGGADGKPVSPGRFIDTETPYRYEWQAVKDSPVGNANLFQPEGVVDHTEVYDYLWTLTEPGGYLERTGSALPIHFSPSTCASPHQDAVLKLEALKAGQPTGVSDQRAIRVYDDHLRRDMANFTPANLAPFDSVMGVMTGGTRQLMFTALTSVSHAYNGTTAGAVFETWVQSTSLVVTATNYPPPVLGPLGRGDVVAYYSDGDLIHAQTCTGEGDETWGANNAPLVWDGQQYAQPQWTFCTSAAGAYCLQGHPDLFPVTLVVYKKP